MPSRQARKTAARRPAGSRIETPGDQPVSSSVQSPTAVPRAKVTRTTSQYHASREVVLIEWIERVPSRAYQAAKTQASNTAKTVELSQSGTPRASVRLSVSSVPTTLISTTASQYGPGT